VVVIVIGCLPAFVARFLTDMDFYSHVADKLLNGAVLYRDALDTKPPAIFFHYAFVFRLFGENNLAAVKAVTIAFLVLSAFAAGGIWRQLFGRRHAALAMLAFACASVSGWAGDFFSSNTEIHANLFILSGVYCLCGGGFSSRPARLATAGVLLGVAFLYRFQSAAVIAAYGVFAYHTVTARSARNRLLWVSAGFAVPSGAIAAWYAAGGRLDALAEFVRYDYFYLRGGGLYWPALVGQGAVVLVSQWPFLILAGARVIHTIRRRSSTSSGEAGDWFLLAWCGFSCLAFAGGARFFAHYYLQALPPVALLAARQLTDREDVGAIRRLDRFALAIGAQAALFLVVNTAVLWWTREPRNPYPALVRFAQAHTTKRDPIYVWTSRTHILFDMDRTYATRFISNDFLVGRMYGTRHRLASATAESARAAAVPELWPLLMHDLEADPPVLVIDDTAARSAFTLDHYPPLDAFVRRRYEPCLEIDGFCVYVRRELK
jgi:hypothetical protein